MPTTLVRGANSFFVNDEDADEFARSAPGFRRVHMVADSGHSVQSDQPACVWSTIPFAARMASSDCADATRSRCNRTVRE